MTDERKSYRTAAYHNRERGHDFRYWVMSPAYEKPGYQIKEHNVAERSAFVSRIDDGLSAQEALIKMATLEQAAAAKYRTVDDSNEDNLRKLGHDYKSAEPQAPHSQALLANINNARIRLREKKSNWKLKP